METKIAQILNQAQTLRARNDRERIASLSDSKLMSGLESLRDIEHNTTVKIVLHIEQVETRKLHLAAGFPSLFDYVLSLGYSRGAAARRISTARCIRTFPQVYPLLLGREVNLSTISVFAPVLNDDNKAELLGKVVGCSRREVEEIVSCYRPKQLVADRITVLGSGELSILDEITRSAGGLDSDDSPREEKKEEGTEQSALRYKLEFEVGREFLEQLEKIEALLSNKFPRGTKLEEVFSALMGEYEQRHSEEKKAERRAERQAKEGQKKNKKQMTEAKTVIAEHDLPQSEPEGSRYIPAVIKEAVFLRDGGRCTFIGANGRRCNTQRCLEYDHITPLALGGQTEITNVRLLCKCHNRLEAEQKLGREFMQRFYSQPAIAHQQSCGFA